MPGRLDGIVDASSRQDRIAAESRTVPRAPGPGDGDRMTTFGAALRHQQVPPARVAAQVRPFGELPAGAGPEPPDVGDHLTGACVDRDLHDPLDTGRSETGPGQQAGAVVVPGKVRVDAGERREAEPALTTARPDPRRA